MTKLHISPELSLPLEAFVTSTQAILAKKGSGKSYTASVQAEELLDAGQQIVAIDPTGAWHGLRSSADGKSAGYSIPVLGGDHADVPLEATAGEVIADAIASEHFSAIIDLSLFRKGEALRFMAAFLETLYRRNRDALHLFVDEADVVAPQKTFNPEQARSLGAMDDIVRRGRIRGIGCTLITQRPQVLNKDVLSQVDMVTALRMNHPKDLGAIDDWVAVHGDPAQAKKMIASLPALPIGEAWLWAPAQDLFERVHIRKRKTFDSGRTPKAGEHVAAPKKLAAVDIAKLGKSIAATVERAKQDDPKALKARVAELERQLAAKPSAKVEARPLLDEKQLSKLEAVIAKADDLNANWAHAIERAEKSLDSAIAQAQAHADRVALECTTLRDLLKVVRAPSERAVAAAYFAKDGKETKLVGKHQLRVYPSKHAAVVSASQPSWGVPPVPGSRLVPAQQKIVDTIATLDALDIESTRTVLAAWLGQHPNTKGLVNNLGALRSAGLVDGYVLTDEGRKLAHPRVPKSRDDVREILLRPLPPAQRRIIEVIEELGGEADRERLAHELHQHPNTKGLVNNIGALRSRALLTQGWPLRLERVFQVVP